MAAGIGAGGHETPEGEDRLALDDEDMRGVRDERTEREQTPEHQLIVALRIGDDPARMRFDPIVELKQTLPSRVAFLRRCSVPGHDVAVLRRVPVDVAPDGIEFRHGEEIGGVAADLVQHRGADLIGGVIDRLADLAQGRVVAQVSGFQQRA
jgi:hypothetical protein